MKVINLNNQALKVLPPGKDLGWAFNPALKSFRHPAGRI